MTKKRYNFTLSAAAQKIVDDTPDGDKSAAVSAALELAYGTEEQKKRARLKLTLIDLVNESEKATA